MDDHPEAEDVGVIKLQARIFSDYGVLIFLLESFAKDFIDDEQDECKIKKDLNQFLLEAGINDDDTIDKLMKLIDHVAELTCPTSGEYSPGCALNVRLDFYHEDEIDYADNDEVFQLSFDETSNTQFRPASKQVVKSLPRKIYNKKIQKENKNTKINKEISLEECTICLEEFSDGGRIVTLPCGHDFDDECIVKWLETSHVCPLCRYEFPCEEDQWTSVVLSQN